MLVNIKVIGGINIESGHIDPKATQGLKSRTFPSSAFPPFSSAHLFLSFLRVTQHAPVARRRASSYSGSACRRSRSSKVSVCFDANVVFFLLFFFLLLRRVGNNVRLLYADNMSFQ